MTSGERLLELFGYYVNLMHLCTGIYLWELITTFKFEWEVYTGRRPWRWSFVVYVTVRVLALSCFIISLVGFDLGRPINCNIWLRLVLFTAWFSLSAASLLLVLRSIAIWGRDIRVIVLTGLMWLINVGGASYALTKSHSEWSPAVRGCATSGTNQFKWSIMINFMGDVVLLSVMICGVLHKRNATHLWKMLYFQGLFWILGAVLTKLPAVTLTFKGINDIWNVMFQYPHLTVMVITASRVYRDLFQYISNPDSSSVRRGRRPREMQAMSVPRPGRDVQVTINKTIEFDVELHLGGDRQALPPRVVDEEIDCYSPALTEEEEQIRTIELQMKLDLEI